MITRGVSETVPVHAFDQKTFHSCTVSGFTSACGYSTGAITSGFFGRIIDRLGLPYRFQSAKVAITAYGDIQASAGSTAMTNYLGVAYGLLHSATTCSADFVDYSTEDWPSEQALQVVTTATSTSASFYSAQQLSANAAGVLSTSLTTSTSTGYAALVDISSKAFPLTAAKRFLKVVVAPHIETTGCAGSNMNVSAALVFGHPEQAPAGNPLGRVWVTSACST